MLYLNIDILKGISTKELAMSKILYTKILQSKLLIKIETFPVIFEVSANINLLNGASKVSKLHGLVRGHALYQAP